MSLEFEKSVTLKQEVDLQNNLGASTVFWGVAFFSFTIWIVAFNMYQDRGYSFKNGQLPSGCGPRVLW